MSYAINLINYFNFGYKVNILKKNEDKREKKKSACKPGSV